MENYTNSIEKFEEKKGFNQISFTLVQKNAFHI